MPDKSKRINHLTTTQIPRSVRHGARLTSMPPKSEHSVPVVGLLSNILDITYVAGFTSQLKNSWKLDYQMLSREISQY